MTPVPRLDIPAEVPRRACSGGLLKRSSASEPSANMLIPRAVALALSDLPPRSVRSEEPYGESLPERAEVEL